MKTFAASILLFLFITRAFAQAEDTLAYNTYDTAYSAYADDSTDSRYSNATYTQHPGELIPAKNEHAKPYTERKFSKTAWKRIVGETNYTEDPTEEQNTKPYKPRSAAWNPAILKIAGYILILLLMGGIIYYLFRTSMQDNGPVKSSIQSDPLLYGKQHIDEVTESDLERLLREAIERNDLRTAVRLYYIKLLKHLHSTGYIAWKKDKTNRDYVRELSAVAFIRDFKKLMTAYEIIWYGERTPNTEEFNRLQANFNMLQQQATQTE